MLLVIPRTTTKKVTSKNILKETTKDLKWNTQKFLFNTKQGSNGETNEGKDIKHIESR